jgi:hypothetical protein
VVSTVWLVAVPLLRVYSTRIMDFSKYPLEKLLYFVAGVVPGFVALLIYQ